MDAVRPSRRVLVVDDDEGVRTVVSWQLEAAGYEVSQARDGVGALQALGGGRHDLVVLDLSLPGLGGLEVLRRVRQGETSASADLPVIILSGRSTQADRIVGLDGGADDYLVKPFSPGELEARVRSVLRRSDRITPPPHIALGDLDIDPAARRVTLRGEPVDLTAKEFDLLVFLAANPRVVFGRRALLDRVWQSASGWQGEATVTEHVHRLRHKIEDDPARPTLLRTVRGAGYQLEPPP